MYKNKILKDILSLMFILLFSIISCLYIYNSSIKKFKDGVTFKETYESLNNKESNSGKKYRTLNIPKDNMIEQTSLKSINKMTNDKKTFYVYFGFKGCPWCRSVIEQMIKTAKENNIKKIYYVDVRPDDIIEKDIRDEYDLNENGEVYLSRVGTNDYHTFLKKYKNVLKDYSHGNVKTLDNTKFSGSKRLGAPNFIYVKKGIPKKLVTGISEKQTDGFMELTDEILTDEYKIFTEFFKK